MRFFLNRHTFVNFYLIRFITYYLGFQNVLDDFNEEENSSNWSNEEHGGQMADVQEEHDLGNDLGNDDDDDDLGDVFDWYQFDHGWNQDK